MSEKQQEDAGRARGGERASDRDGSDKVVRPATAWHPPFYGLMSEGAPPSTEIRTEIVLSQQPRRADLLLLRRRNMSRRDGEARVLRGLWPLLGPVTLAEFKGPKSGFRSHDLLRLLGYGTQYNELNMQALGGPSGLTLALLTPAETPSLQAAVDYMGWRLERLGNGYARIAGAWYTTFVAFIDEVCEAERDDYLRLFSRHRRQTHEAVRWLNARCLRMTTMETLRELDGYDDLVERLLSTLTPEEVLRHYRPEERLAGLGPEERLAGLGPEERLAGLGPEERLAGLGPEERLAGLGPEEVLRHYGLELLLGHLRALAPAERAAVEGNLPAAVLEALRKYVDGMP
jgi:hypothetical protein